MRIVSVTVEGFLGIKNSTRVDFPRNGIYAITGRNGVGKSALYTEAPTWCLFDNTIREDVTDNAIINRHSDSCSVTVVLEEDNGTLYSIQRTKKRNKKSVLIVETNDNWKEIEDGTIEPPWREMFPAKDRLELQKQFEDWLGLDYRTFINSICFGQGLAALFASSSLSDSERKSIFDRIYGLEFYEVARSKVKEQLDVKSVEWQNATSTLTQLRGRLTNLKELGDQLRSSQESWGTGQHNRKVTINEQLAEKKRQAESYSAMHLEVNNAISECTAGIRIMNDRLSDLRKYQILQGEIEFEIESIDRRILNVRHDINTIKHNLTAAVPNCPTCGRPWNPEAIEASRITMRESLEKAEKDLQELTESRNFNVDLLEKTKKTSAPLQKLYDEQEKESRKSDSLRSKRAEVAGILESIKKGLAELDAELIRIESEVNPWTEKVVTNQTEWWTVNNTIKETEESVNGLLSQIEDLKFWFVAYGPGGVRSFLIESLLPEFNRLIANNLSEMTDGGITAKVSATVEHKKGTVSERLSIIIDNINGADTYGGNSGGEKRRIDLSILLALQQLVSFRAVRPFQFCIYDEIFDQLDSDGAPRVVNMLRLRATDKPVFVISHHEMIKSLVDDIINIG